MTSNVYAQLAFLSFATTATWCIAAAADEPHMHIGWPSDWEFQHVTREGLPYIELTGRQRDNGRVLQKLSIRIIDARTASEAIADSDIRDLARKLLDRFGSGIDTSDLRPFANARGYYFIVTDRRSEKSPQYRHLIEGVMLDSGYLVEFVLQSNDAHAPDTLAMLSALGKFAIR